MKKNFGVLLTISLLLLVISACGNSQNDSKTESTNAEETTEESQTEKNTDEEANEEPTEQALDIEIDEIKTPGFEGFEKEVEKIVTMLVNDSFNAEYLDEKLADIVFEDVRASREDPDLDREEIIKGHLKTYKKLSKNIRDFMDENGPIIAIKHNNIRDTVMEYYALDKKIDMKKVSSTLVFENGNEITLDINTLAENPNKIINMYSMDFFEQ